MVSGPRNLDKNNFRPVPRGASFARSRPRRGGACAGRRSWPPSRPSSRFSGRKSWLTTTSSSAARRNAGLTLPSSSLQCSASPKGSFRGASKSSPGGAVWTLRFWTQWSAPGWSCGTPMGPSTFRSCSMASTGTKTGARRQVVLERPLPLSGTQIMQATLTILRKKQRPLKVRSTERLYLYLYLSLYLYLNQRRRRREKRPQQPRQNFQRPSTRPPSGKHGRRGSSTAGRSASPPPLGR